jgi:hypothetical protein
MPLARKTRRTLLCFVIMILFMTAIAMAQPVQVRYREGSVHGFLALSTLEGRALASGDLIQTVRGDRVEVRTVFHFKDGSLDDEQAVFSQRGTFRLISDHHIQKGPAFPHPMDLMIDAASGRVTAKYQEDNKDKSDSQHLDLSPDVANGLLLTVLKNIPAKLNQFKFDYVAAAPKPKLVHLNITREGEATFAIGGANHKATRFQVKVEIGGVSGAIAPLVGKQPTDINIWILQNGMPAFVRLEGALYPQGPIWVIELAAPSSFKQE